MISMYIYVLNMGIVNEVISDKSDRKVRYSFKIVDRSRRIFSR